LRFKFDIETSLEEVKYFEIFTVLLNVRSKLRSMIWFDEYKPRFSVYNAKSDIPNTISLWQICADKEIEDLRITIVNSLNLPLYYNAQQVSAEEFCLINIADMSVRLFIKDGDQKSEISDGRSRGIEGITLCRETVFDS